MSDTNQEVTASPSPAGEQTDKVDNPEAVLQKNKELIEEKKKVQDQFKKLQDDYRTLKSKLDDLEDVKVDDSTDPKQAVVALKKKVEEKDKGLKQTQLNYARLSARKAVEAAALKTGCNNMELLMRAVDLGDVYVDGTTFEADTTSIEVLLDDAKKKYPILFGNPKANVQDVNPKFQPMKSGKTDLSKMSMDELKAYAKKIDEAERSK